MLIPIGLIFTLHDEFERPLNAASVDDVKSQLEGASNKARTVEQ
jgi:hypothetical protein